MFNFIVWNGSPIVFSIGPFVLRWYVLLFVLGFFTARAVLAYIYKKEGKPASDVEKLIIYILVAAVIGVRLGYVLFYEPNTILTKPLEAFLPFQFKPSFQFAGIERLSGYGGVIAVVIVIWLYVRKGKGDQKYFKVLDRVMIAIALTGVFVGIGNFFNAEIPGKPTSSKSGVIFIRPVTDGLQKLPCCIMRNPGGENPLQNVEVKPDTALHPETKGHSALLLYLFYRPGATEQLVKEFLIGDVKTFLFDNPKLMYESGEEPLHYTIFQEKEDVFIGRVRTTGIARHPVQLYEAISYFLLFIVMFVIWNKSKSHTPAGTLTGIFLISSAVFNFIFGFLKEPQATFESSMALNIGQILSISMLILGFVVLRISFQKPEEQ
ncbi:MAG TPA: prolipoprotein diacylglyceryl transferase [Chryseolinea sp.]|nr:prolipoprotein diacylglyceryl transferase [Chryseolinea sp.]